MRAARVDRNQREIVAALRRVGASVQPLHTVGGGVPDLLVGFRGGNYLIEVKSEKGIHSGDQVEWHGAWRGRVETARNVDDALSAIGACAR